MKHCEPNTCTPDRSGICTQCKHEVLSPWLDPETPPAAGATVAALRAAPAGSWARDATGDEWYRQGSGNWLYPPELYELTPVALHHVWGPITLIDKDTTP